MKNTSVLGADGGQRRFEFIRFGKRYVDEWNQPYSLTPILSLVEPKLVSISMII